MGETCKCTFCNLYKYYKWAVIKECKCGCHESDGMVAHDNLCCSIPNGLIKNNPYNELESAEYYKTKIEEWEKENDL